MWDEANAVFEFVGGAFMWLNVRRLYLDKRTAGVSPVAVLFFVGWGFWNLWYYPAIGQLWSFVGGISIVLANVTWLALLWKYNEDAKTKDQTKDS